MEQGSKGAGEPLTPYPNDYNFTVTGVAMGIPFPHIQFCVCPRAKIILQYYSRRC